MAAIDRREVGAHVAGKVVTFGAYLPGIRAADGFDLSVRVIHRADQFVPEVPALAQRLTFQPQHPLGLWQGQFDLSAVPNPPGNFGQDGEYLYRFSLARNGQPVAPHFLDPFATGSGPAFLSSFTVGPAAAFAWTDDAFRVPELDDLILYELQVQEFASTFQGIIPFLDYLKGLGVNCLELMPVNPVKRGFDWGYGPMGYFTVEEAFGGGDGLKQLVDAAHAEGMAVILDVVFGHSGYDFPYALVYDASGVKPNPMMQDPNRDQFGRGNEFANAFTQQFFLEVTKHWLTEYHADGFRYDNVPGFYDGPTGTGYAKLVFDTYRFSRGVPRFQGDKYSRIIQVAEDLDDPRKILRDTFSRSTWQDELLNKATDMATWRYVDDGFAHLLDPSFTGYPDTKDGAPAGDQPFPVAPLQYLETHDHSRLIAAYGLESTDPKDLPLGNRDRWANLQPFAVALYTCRGVPMLYQGQEFAENYVLTPSGTTRVGIRRGVHFEYFYDDSGQPLVRLYRRLAKLRRALPALRSRDMFYYNEVSRVRDGVVVYRRHTVAANGQPAQTAIVLLNFSDADATLSVPVPAAGTYREVLDAPYRATPLEVTAAAGQAVNLTVPSNYGQIFVTPPADV
jgi:1,4-alpha-glucan branching enzyme